MTKQTKFESLVKQHQSLLIGRWLTDLANTAAFIFHEVENLNWAGFYILNGEDLWLGPFQGKPACTQIKIGRGVCGQAVAQKKTLLVEDVEQFADHIVCDSVSKSEMVVPIFFNGSVVGVLDVDAPIVGRFEHPEQVFFEKVIANLVEANRNSSFPRAKV